MANLTFDFRSTVLGKETKMNVILPDNADVPRRGWKTLYLLHGWSDNYQTWMSQTSIERYAQKRHLAVVMPDGEFSFYNDMADGLKYFTFISEEVPAVAAKYFRCSTRREDTYIGGLSMGGLGALSIGLSRPENYAGIIVLSSANWPNNMFHEQYDSGRMPEPWYRSMRRIYGDVFPNLEGTEYDCFVKADRVVANGGPFPVLYHYCGLEETDLLRHSYIMKERFLSYEGNPFRYTLSTYHGVHNWDAWDAVICEAMDYVGLKEIKPAAKKDKKAEPASSKARKRGNK